VVYATDIATHRLEAATRHGAIALSKAELESEVSRITSGRGADAVLEVVGHESALLHAIEMVRPFGVVSSCGVHTHTLSLVGSQLYAKKYVIPVPRLVWGSDRDSIRLQFGRCSVPKYYEGGLKVLNDNRELFSTFVENKIRLDQATEVSLPEFESHVEGADVAVLRAL
jgi:threonine dehydrogenase-like Zn-dependent dehydrogenase